MIILSNKAASKLKIASEGDISISDNIGDVQDDDVFVGFGCLDKQRKAYPNKTIFSCETGFFYGMCHIDSHGLYDKSSLCRQNIEQCIFPIVDRNATWLNTLSILENVVLLGQSKYKQTEEKVPFEEFILIPAQRPKDSQIKSVRDDTFQRNYYSFLEEILSSCSDNKKKFLVKKHPMSSAGEDEAISLMAKHYGGTYGNFSMQSCMRACDRVIAYNSTVIVDAMFYSKPVFVFGPGYFSCFESCMNSFCNTPNKQMAIHDAVTGTPVVDIAARKKLLAFLYNAYCIKRREPSSLRAAINMERSWESYGI